MMLYEFVADDGEVILKNYPMTKAPELGAAVRAHGKTYRRRLSLAVGNATAYDHDQYPKISSTLPEWSDGAEHVQTGRNRGKCIIQSRRHQDELCRMHGYTRDYHPSDMNYQDRGRRLLDVPLPKAIERRIG